MSTTEEVRGVVIRVADYNEHDRIIVIYSAEKGIIKASAKGSHSFTSKILAAIQPFSVSRFLLSEKNDFYFIKEATLQDSFFAISESLEKVYLASYFCELIECVSTNEPDLELFRLLVNSLYLISKSSYSLHHIKSTFEVRLASVLGFEPNIDECSVCGTEQKLFYFDVLEGTIYCQDCYEKLKMAMQPDEFRKKVILQMAPSTKQAFQFICQNRLEKIFMYKVNDENNMDYCAEKFLINQIDSPIKTLDFLNKVL